MNEDERVLHAMAQDGPRAPHVPKGTKATLVAILLFALAGGLAFTVDTTEGGSRCDTYGLRLARRANLDDDRQKAETRACKCSYVYGPYREQEEARERARELEASRKRQCLGAPIVTSDYYDFAWAVLCRKL